MRLMRRTERGFTLVELMITIAIIGILSAIAIPTFIGFMSKGKKVEATLALDKMTKNIRVYHAEKRTLPPSTNVMPPSCMNCLRRSVVKPLGPHMKMSLSSR